MKRTAALPEYLAPWLELGSDGVVRCRKCPSAFVGEQASDAALAQHVSRHIGAAPLPISPPPPNP